MARGLPQKMNCYEFGFHEHFSFLCTNCYACQTCLDSASLHEKRVAISASMISPQLSGESI